LDELNLVPPRRVALNHNNKWVSMGGWGLTQRKMSTKEEFVTALLTFKLGS